MDKELQDLVLKARDRKMTPEELENQRIAFAYGNAPRGDTNTKETVRDAILESKISRTFG